jgi:hypothetical protein
MPRVTPTPVEVLVEGAWTPGVVRTCDVAPDGSTCTAVVSYGGSNAVTTARFPANLMRSTTGEPGCPADQ